jgi:hypothetical protein
VSENFDLSDPWGALWAHPSPYDLGRQTAGMRIPKFGMPTNPSALLVQPLTTDTREKEKEHRRKRKDVRDYL